MATNFPGSLDNGTSLPYPNATNGRNAPSLAQGQDNQNDALIAVETKLGTGASTATSGNLLIGTGAGTSAWTKAAPTGTIVGTSDTQTLTNKTLTSPTINNPVISNATITADIVSGFTSSNTGTIYGIAIASGSISGANTINGSALVAGTIGSTALATNAVQGSQIATNAITLGYVQSTSNFTTTSTTPVQVTGLTLTVTIPAGARRVRISAFAAAQGITATTGYTTLSIWSGTVNSGTQLSSCIAYTGTGGAQYPAFASAVISVAAGSQTYNVGFVTTAGTGQIVAASSSPAYLLVEAI